MNRLLIVSVLFVVTACRKGKDFSRIKTGMHSGEVLQLTGTPDRKMSMIGSEWWLYNDSAKHLVIISSDTVANVTTQREAMRVMEETLKAADSLKSILQP